jgi:hypothetical protein
VTSGYNIYKGKRSCYYRKEGVLIQYDWEIPDMIMRDLRRGWTYDHDCSVVPMDKALAQSRLAFLLRITNDETARMKARKYLDMLREEKEYAYA